MTRAAAEVATFRAGWEKLWGAERAAELYAKAERRAQTIPPGSEHRHRLPTVENQELLKETSGQQWACNREESK